MFLRLRRVTLVSKEVLPADRLDPTRDDPHGTRIPSPPGPAAGPRAVGRPPPPRRGPGPLRPPHPAGTRRPRPLDRPGPAGYGQDPVHMLRRIFQQSGDDNRFLFGMH